MERKTVFEIVAGETKLPLSVVKSYCRREDYTEEDGAEFIKRRMMADYFGQFSTEAEFAAEFIIHRYDCETLDEYARLKYDLYFSAREESGDYMDFDEYAEKYACDFDAVFAAEKLGEHYYSIDGYWFIR